MTLRIQMFSHDVDLIASKNEMVYFIFDMPE